MQKQIERREKRTRDDKGKDKSGQRLSKVTLKELCRDKRGESSVDGGRKHTTSRISRITKAYYMITD